MVGFSALVAHILSKIKFKPLVIIKVQFTPLSKSFMLLRSELIEVFNVTYNGCESYPNALKSDLVDKYVVPVA